MLFLQQALLAVILFLTVISATSLEKQGRFTVNHEPIDSLKRSPEIDLANAYRKYGRTIPVHIATAAAKAKNDDGTVAATPLHGLSGLPSSNVSIGGQTLRLLFDTGSSDLWVLSTLLPKPWQDLHSPGTLYHPSQTSKLNDSQSWSVTYESGVAARGLVAVDDVSIGLSNEIAQSVELATNVSLNLLHNGADGFLGLGFDNVNGVKPNQVKTFFSNVKDSLDQPLFTANFKHDLTGSWDFGFINPTKHVGDIKYVDVDSSHGWWMVNVTSFAVGDGSFQGPYFQAIVDSGTPLLYLPNNVVTEYYNKVPLATLQGNKIRQTATIPISILNPNAKASGTCMGILQSAGITILGDPFFRSFFIVFEAKDNEIPRIGLAPQAP